VLVDTMMVLMQVGRDGDWTDRGVPEVVTGYDRGPGPIAAAAEWMFDSQPGVIGDDWRLLVWTDVRGGAWDRDKPDAVLTGPLYRAAIAERHLRPSRMRRARIAPVTTKIRAAQVELGMQVLVTRDRRNAAVAGPGPWYLADRIEPDCAAARINGRAVLTRGGRDIITFRTNIGEIGGNSSGVTVIPVDED
jgi:hypothetical protein